MQFFASSEEERKFIEIWNEGCKIKPEATTELKASFQVMQPAKNFLNEIKNRIIQYLKNDPKFIDLADKDRILKHHQDPLTNIKLFKRLTISSSTEIKFGDFFQSSTKAEEDSIEVNKIFRLKLVVVFTCELLTKSKYVWCLIFLMISLLSTANIWSCLIKQKKTLYYLFLIMIFQEEPLILTLITLSFTSIHTVVLILGNKLSFTCNFITVIILFIINLLFTSTKTEFIYCIRSIVTLAVYSILEDSSR